MTTHLDSTTWARICELAEYGPQPGQSFSEIEAFLTRAEEITNRARAVIQPSAVSPAKARLLRYPVKSKGEPRS